VESTRTVFWDLIIYLFIWFFFTTTTYGIWVPAGIFIPGMILGCTLGLLYLQMMLFGFGVKLIVIGGQSYMVIGAAAMLSSYTRLTYSLAVIMLETTDAINLFVPIMLSIFVSHAVARQFNRSIYEYSIRAKQMPLLRNHLPEATKSIMV
jgi:H+/Cl- antiporter ClcA